MEILLTRRGCYTREEVDAMTPVDKALIVLREDCEEIVLQMSRDLQRWHWERTRGW